MSSVSKEELTSCLKNIVQKLFETFCEFTTGYITGHTVRSPSEKNVWIIVEYREVGNFCNWWS